jgi:hypothetical protein
MPEFSGSLCRNSTASWAKLISLRANRLRPVVVKPSHPPRSLKKVSATSPATSTVQAAGTPQIFADRGAADPQRLRDQTLARPAGMLQTKYFSNLAHWQSLGRHPIPSLSLRGHGSRRQIANLESNCPPFRGGRGGPASIGTGGRLPSESLAAFRRNSHPWLRLDASSA